MIDVVFATPESERPVIATCNEVLNGNKAMADSTILKMDLTIARKDNNIWLEENFQNRNLVSESKSGLTGTSIGLYLGLRNYEVSKETEEVLVGNFKTLGTGTHEYKIIFNKIDLTLDVKVVGYYVWPFYHVDSSYKLQCKLVE